MRGCNEGKNISLNHTRRQKKPDQNKTTRSTCTRLTNTSAICNPTGRFKTKARAFVYVFHTNTRAGTHTSKGLCYKIFLTHTATRHKISHPNTREGDGKNYRFFAKCQNVPNFLAKICPNRPNMDEICPNILEKGHSIAFTSNPFQGVANRAVFRITP